MYQKHSPTIARALADFGSGAAGFTRRFLLLVFLLFPLLITSTSFRLLHYRTTINAMKLGSLLNPEPATMNGVNEAKLSQVESADKTESSLDRNSAVVAAAARGSSVSFQDKAVPATSIVHDGTTPQAAPIPSFLLVKKERPVDTLWNVPQNSTSTHGHHRTLSQPGMINASPSIPASVSTTAPPPLLPDELLRTTILWRAFSDQMDSIRMESGPDENMETYSAQHLSWVFNTKEINYRNQLWSDWTIYATLWDKLGVRAFPISERKVTLLVSQFVDLPCSASLRQAYGSVSTAHNVNLHRAESMLNTLKLAGQATEHLWPRTPSFNDIDPDRFEILREVWQRIPWFKVSKKTRVKPAVVRRERTLTAEPARRRPSAGSAGSPKSRALLNSPSLYEEEGFGLVSFPRLMSDLPMVAQDLRLLQPDPTLAQLGHGRLHTALVHEGMTPIDVRFSIRRIWSLYSDLSSKFIFPDFPITPIKLALFAFAYTPGPVRTEFDQISNYAHTRHFPAFIDANSFVTALETMESLQRLTRGPGEINAYEADQWLLWRKSFLEDLLTSKRPENPWSNHSSRSPHTSGSVSLDSNPSRSSTASTSATSISSSSTAKNNKQRLPSAAPLVPKGAQSPTQVPMKRNRSNSGSPDTNYSDQSEICYPAGIGGISETMSKTRSASGSINGSNRRPGRPKKQVRRTPTPPPQPWKPVKIGQLPDERRPPPLPPVFAHPLVFGTGEEADMERSVALHRPKRNLAFKMIPLANLDVLA